MKVTITKLQDSKSELLVEVPADKQSFYLKRTAERLAKEIKIAGFRPGKAPYEVVKNQVGEEKIWREAIEELVRHNFVLAVVQEKLDTVGPPEVSIESAVLGQAVTFKAVVTILPEVNVVSLTEIKAPKFKVEVDPVKLEAVIEQVKKSQVKEVLVERPVEEGDKVTLEMEIKRAGVIIEHGEKRDYNFILGEQQFIPGFMEKIIGQSAGQSLDFKLTFPEKYHVATLAGGECHFFVTIKAVFSRTKPELTDELVENVGQGWKSVADFKKSVTDRLEAEEKQQEEQRCELEVLAEIVKKSTFSEIPEILISSELEKMRAEFTQQLGEGAKLEDYLKSQGKDEASLDKEFRPLAVERVKTTLLLRQISKDQKIKVAAEVLEREIKKASQMYQDQPEVQTRVKSEEYRDYLRLQLQNKEAVAYLRREIKW